LAPFNIRVNAVAPGMTRTPLYQEWLDGLPDPEGEAKRVAAAIPLGRIAEPEDVAAVVNFLASEQASYLTGTSIPVEGGYLAQSPARLLRGLAAQLFVLRRRCFDLLPKIVGQGYNRTHWAASLLHATERTLMSVLQPSDERLAASDAALASLPGFANHAPGADEFAVLDPSTEQPIATLPNRSVEYALEQVTIADEAGRAWAKTTPRHRSDTLHRVYDVLIANRDRLAYVISREMGKT